MNRHRHDGPGEHRRQRTQQGIGRLSAWRCRLKAIEAAAKKLRLSILHMEARNALQIEVAVATMAQNKVEAMIVPVDQVFIAQWRQIAELAVKHRLPCSGASCRHASTERARSPSAAVDALDHPHHQPPAAGVRILAKSGERW